MISKIKSYQTSDQSVFPTLELAQAHELTMFLTDKQIGSTDDDYKEMAGKLIGHKDHIINLLKMTTTRKKRTPKAAKPAKTKTTTATTLTKD